MQEEERTFSEIKSGKDDDEIREDYANYLNNMGLCHYHKASDDDPNVSHGDDMVFAQDHFI